MHMSFFCCTFAAEIEKIYHTMTAKRGAELGKKRAQLLQIMLGKAGITKTEIHDVAERRWVNANLDLLTAAEKQQYAEVLSL